MGNWCCCFNKPDCDNDETQGILDHPIGINDGMICLFFYLFFNWIFFCFVFLIKRLGDSHYGSTMVNNNHNVNQSYQNQKTTKINPYFCPHHYSIANHHHNPDEIFIIPNKFDKNFECSVSNCSSLSSTPSWRTLFNTSLLTIKLWILLTLIYRNLNKFACSYFSIIIILLPATQALIFCLAVSKDITLVSGQR